MSEASDRFTVEIPEGKVYVTILPAITEEWHEAGQGRVSAEFPVIRVSTYPGNSWQVEPEFIKYRGRRYSIDDPQVFSGKLGGQWTGERRKYGSRGFRNEAGTQVDWKSPALDTLRAIVDRVREQFVTEHPEWAKVSQRLRIEQDLRHADEQVSKLAKDLQVAEAKAAALRSRLASFRV